MKSLRTFLIFFFFVPLVTTYGLLSIVWRYKFEFAILLAAIFFLASFNGGLEFLKLK